MATERVGIHSFDELEASIGNAKTAADVKTTYESNLNTNAFTDAEKSKLSGVESGAEVNPTDAEIKTAYENNANTNAFTDAEQTKLAGIATGAEVNAVDSVNAQTGVVVLDADDISDSTTTNKFTNASDISKLAGIEESADVTDATNVSAAGALMSGTAVISDLNDVASTAPTDGQVLTYDTTNGWQPETPSAGGAVDSVNGQTGTVSLDTADLTDVDTAAPTDGQVLRYVSASSKYVPTTLSSTAPVDSVNGQTGSVVLDADDISDATTTNKYTTASDITKLAGIEANADVTDSANVTTALGSISVTAHSDVTDSGSGIIISAAERTKLSGIEAGAEVNAVDSVFGRTGAVTAQSGDYTKSDVGLANVDNTSDADKPISTATQTALDAKQGDITLTTTGTSGAATLIGDTLNIPQYSAGGGGIAAVVDDTTPQLGGDLDLNTYDVTGTGNINITGTVTSDEFIGDVNGAIRFAAKNESGATLLKGKVVSITGVSGNETLVDLADADDATARPAFGLVYADANNNAACEVVTFGNLTDLNTSAFTEGDTLYVSTSAGELTATPPSGESADIQNIGRVIRSHASAGIIKVGGAGRANATPNLDSAKMFLGNASNQAVSVAMSGDVTIDNTGVTTVGTINSVAVATVTSGAALGATANQDSTATILAGDLTGTVNSVAVATVTSGAALGATSVQPSDNVSTLTNDADYLPSDPTGVTGADVITNIMSLTQAEYDAIATPDASTLYIIT